MKYFRKCYLLILLGLFAVQISVSQADEGPQAFCTESVNPHGETTPPAGNTTLPGPRGGQNEDGFYELAAVDALGVILPVFVVDDGSGAAFGPFSSGDVIKYTEDSTAVPSAKPIGSSNGRAGAVVAHIIGNGDAIAVAVDFLGNVGTAPCFVPPKM